MTFYPLWVAGCSDYSGVNLLYFLFWQPIQRNPPECLLNYSNGATNTDSINSHRQNQHHVDNKHYHLEYLHNRHHFPHQQSRRRPRPPAYEMGDEEIFIPAQSQMKSMETPQWGPNGTPLAQAPTQRRREKTPGPPRTTFYIATHEQPNSYRGGRQSCPPSSNPVSLYETRCAA